MLSQQSFIWQVFSQFISVDWTLVIHKYSTLPVLCCHIIHGKSQALSYRNTNKREKKLEPHRSMFSTRKRCLIGIPIWGYQNFYSLPPKNWILGPKTAKFGPKLAFWAKYRHFWPIWSNAWPKNNADKLSRWFSVMLVSKLLLTPIKTRIFGPKTAKFGPKYAFLVILGQILASSAHFARS